MCYLQVADTGEVDQNEGRDFVADSLDLEANQLSTEEKKHENSKQGNGMTDMLPPSVAYPQKKSRKRGRKATQKKSRNHQAEKQRNSTNNFDVDSERLLKVNQEQTWDNKNYSSNLGKTNKRGKKVFFSTSSKTTPHTAQAPSNISGILSNGEEKMVNESPASPCKQEHEKNFNLKNSRKSQRKMSGKQKLGNVHNIVEESSPMQNHNNEYAGSPSFISSFQMDNNGKASDSKQNESSSARKSKSYNTELRSNKKLKLSSDGISRHTNGEETQPTERTHRNPDSGALNDSSKEKQCSWKDEVVLRKCESHIKRPQCAFCLSSEESEVRLLVCLLAITPYNYSPLSYFPTLLMYDRYQVVGILLEG